MVDAKAKIKRAKVLVVDDDPDILTAIQNGIEIENLKLEVEVATDGVSGLEKAIKTRPDVIILDLLMPKMDGLTVLQKLKSDPFLVKSKVIMLTAQDNKKNRWESLYLDVDDFLAKPFDLYELEALIYYHLVGKRLRK